MLLNLIVSVFELTGVDIEDTVLSFWKFAKNRKFILLYTKKWYNNDNKLYVIMNSND